MTLSQVEGRRSVLRGGRWTFQKLTPWTCAARGQSYACTCGAAAGRQPARRDFFLSNGLWGSSVAAVKTASDLFLVLTTAPNIRTARRLARALLEKRLAACINVIPKLESHYRWQGKLEVSREALLLIKTGRKQLASLEKAVLTLHPYDTPELISVALSSGSPRYLSWLVENLG